MSEYCRLIFELVAANDTALHLAFRMQDKKILLTADLNGTKNIEEKEMDSFLFGPGRDFEVSSITTSTVSFGKHLHDCRNFLLVGSKVV